jgi:uncharacterized protein
MTTDHIRYDILTQDAMRGVIRTALQDAATRGLLGEHHFYITFDTRPPEVKIHQRIRAQYPEEMTIVLQHQFWDLIVTDVGFEVGLSFNGIRERLGIPFSAIKSFADPSVKFAMQFTELSETPITESGDTPAEDAAAPAPAKSEEAGTPSPDSAPAAAASPDEKPTAEIVRIDRFRKK